MYGLLLDYSKTLYGEEQIAIYNFLSSMEFFPYRDHSADPAIWSDFKHYAQEAEDGKISVVKKCIDCSEKKLINKFKLNPNDPRDFLSENKKQK